VTDVAPGDRTRPAEQDDPIDPTSNANDENAAARVMAYATPTPSLPLRCPLPGARLGEG
jgi:hypothetical protein